MDTKELETLDLLHYSPVGFNGGLFGPPFPVVHNQLLCLAHNDGEVVVLSPRCQVSDLLPIGCLIIVGDQAYHCCVISKLNDVVRVVFGHTVNSVEDQRGRRVVAYPYHLGAARQDVQDPVAEWDVLSPRVLSLVMSLVGTMVLNTEL